MYTPVLFRNPKFIKPFPLENVRILVIQFLSCSLCFIISGIVFLVLSYQLEEPTDVLQLLQAIPGFNLNSYVLLKGVCGVQIVVGTIGFLVHTFGYTPKILCSFPSALRIPFGLIGLSAYEAAQIGIRNFDEELNKIARRELFYYTHRDILKPISNDTLLIGKFQEKFQCCGKESPRDWLLSGCDCLPLSCCKSDKYETCSNQTTYTNTGAHKNLSHYDFKAFESRNSQEHIFWSKGCHEKVMNVVSRLGKNMMSSTAIILTIQVILTIWMSHITQMIFHLFDSREGFAQLQIYKGKWPRKNVKVQDAFKSFVRALDPLSADVSEEEVILNQKRPSIIDAGKHNKVFGDNESIPGSIESGKTSILYIAEKKAAKNKHQ